MTDVVSWTGARNLRDLGGRALRDGGITARGRVFRSAAPEYLTDEGWVAGKTAGLRDWVRTFDTTTYLESVGLTRREIGSLKALLRP